MTQPHSSSFWVFFFSVFLALCGLYSIFLMHPLDLTLEDMGRHLTNGRVVFEQSAVLFTNFYSYTQPNFPFINHHWLAGVVFYQIVSHSNIEVLTLCYCLMMFTALLLFLRRMLDRGGLLCAALVAPIGLLFLAERHVVRPEGFGYFFILLFLFMLDRLEKMQKFSWRLIVFFTAVELAWVNLHISFIFGIFIVGTYFLEAVLKWWRTRKITPYFRSLFILMFSTSIATLFNPNGLRGALYPLSIFSQYGYDIVENKSLVFLSTRIFDPGINLYFIVVSVLLVVIVARFVVRKRLNTGEFIRIFTAIILGWTALRNLPLFGILVFPFLAESLFVFAQAMKWSANARASIKILAIGAGGVMYLLFFALVGSGTYHPSISIKKMGLGYVSTQFAAADFYKSLHIEGNIFNNYDIGSYLIYTLYPQRLFVDNRPEAYSVDFFKKEYIPMQQDDAVWQAELKKYDFQTIFFGHRDLTPWAQTFLFTRLKDPTWKAVYFDDKAIIFVRNTPAHAEIIKKFGMSSEELIRHHYVSH